jgi:hypothetical protein
VYFLSSEGACPLNRRYFWAKLLYIRQNQLGSFDTGNQKAYILCRTHLVPCSCPYHVDVGLHCSVCQIKSWDTIIMPRYLAYPVIRISYFVFADFFAYGSQIKYEKRNSIRGTSGSRGLIERETGHPSSSSGHMMRLAYNWRRLNRESSHLSFF